jgi:hypothetical protein
VFHNLDLPSLPFPFHPTIYVFPVLQPMIYSPHEILIKSCHRILTPYLPLIIIRVPQKIALRPLRPVSEIYLPTMHCMQGPSPTPAIRGIQQRNLMSKTVIVLSKEPFLSYQRNESPNSVQSDQASNNSGGLITPGIRRFATPNKSSTSPVKVSVLLPLGFSSCIGVSRLIRKEGEVCIDPSSSQGMYNAMHHLSYYLFHVYPKAPCSLRAVIRHSPCLCLERYV